MKTETLVFRVTGKFLTKIARDISRGGDHQKAYNLLKEALPGISVRQVYRILKGESWLEGASDDPKGIVYVNNQEYLEAVEELLGVS